MQTAASALPKAQSAEKLPTRLTRPHRELSTEKRGKKMKKRRKISYGLIIPCRF